MKIGLTGGIGSGKSTVAKYLKEKGYVVVDADRVARDVMIPGGSVLKRLTEVFGMEILNGDGTLDRKALGVMVFGDNEKRETLNRISHGEIIGRIRETMDDVQKESRDKIIFLDAPILFETGLDKYVDRVWSVEADIDEKVRRVLLRDGVDKAYVMKIISAQLPDEERRKRANTVIENDGTLEELYSKIEVVLKDYA